MESNLPFRVLGKLMDHLSSPLANHKVLLTQTDGKLAETKTNQNGEFELVSKPPATNTVTIYVTTKDGVSYAQVTLSVKTEIEPNSPLVLQLDAGNRLEMKGSEGAKIFTISGYVVDVAERSTAGLRVEAWDKVGETTGFLGAANVNEMGQFELSFPEAAFIPHDPNDLPGIFFNLFQGDVPLSSSESGTIKNIGSTRVSDVAITVDLSAAGAPSGKIRSVSGQIALADGRGIADLSVIAVDKHLGGETKLGMATTNAMGRYSLKYSVDLLRAKNKERADLILRAFQGASTEPLAEAPMRLNAKDHETINLSVGSTEYVGLPDSEVKAGAIGADIQDLDTSTLTDQDISYLANKADMTEREAADYVHANTLGNQIGVDSTIIFALLQKSFTGEPGELVTMDKTELANAIKEAAEQNKIPAAYANDTEAAALNLKQKIAELAIPPGQTVTPVQEAFGLAGLNKTEMRNVVSQMIQTELEPEEFWSYLVTSSTLSQAKADDLRFVTELAAVTRNNTPLVQVLKANSALRETRDLVKFKEADWVDILSNNGITTPEYVEGASAEEKRENYARQMLHAVEETWATPMLAERIRTDSVIPNTHFNRFFSDNPDFEFKNDLVTTYLQENETALNGVPASDREEFTADLKAVERLFQVAPAADRYKAVAALWSSDLRSANAINRVGQAQFVAKHEASMGKEMATSVYNKASHIAHSAMATMSMFGAEYNSGTPTVINGNSFGPGDSIDQIPDLESLFGSLDFCSCKHCRSVYSAAAYLADLLAFLNEVDVTVSQTVKDKLFARRGEIGELLLNCENTNTPVPYIDLVNEVLENAVSAYPSFDLQTTLSAAALKANPEHINPAAYNLLSTQIYPFGLPFSLWQEEARTYLEHLGVAPAQLMKTMPAAATAISDLDIATETLGLLELERKIITGTGPGTLMDYFGVVNISDLNKPSTSLVSIIKLMEQSDLSFDELLEVLKSKWVNPQEKPITYDGASCALDGATINLNTTELDRFHRFTRLWRKVGMTTVDLDQSIRALLETNIYNSFIIKLAGVQTLQSRFAIPVPEMLTWWGPIPTFEYEGETPLYDQLFLNRTVNNPIDAVETIFGLNTSRTELATLTYTIDDPNVSQYVLAAINITAEDLALLIERELPNNTLKLYNLSQLYRIASFCRALDISIPEYLSLKALTGQQALTQYTASTGTPPPYVTNPIVYATPADTIAFTDHLATVAASDFNVEDLDFLLRHEFPTTSTIALDETALETLLSTVHTDLNKLKTDLQATGENDRETASNILGLLMDDATRNESISIIDGNSLNTETDQNTFIDNNFNSFIPATGLPTAKANLVTGGGTLIGEAARYGYILPLLEAHLANVLIPAAMAAYIKETFSGELSLSSGVMDQMLNTYVHNPNATSQLSIEVYRGSAFVDSTNAITRSNFPDQFATYELLHKAGFFLTKVKAREVDLEYLFVNSPTNWIDPETFPLSNTAPAASFDGWQRMVRTFALNEMALSEDFSFPDLLNQAVNGETEANTFAALVDQTGWPFADLQYLAGTNGYDYATGDPNYRHKEAWLLELDEAFAILKRLGVDAQQAKSWNVVNITQAIATAIRNSAKAKYENEQWLSIAPPLRDVLREKQRDALSAYLMAQNPQFPDLFALYEHYLIDTEMSACGVTTRIKLAISSAQLFVQRIIMNLEPGISFTRALVKEWQWRKNYRVWEANRKVFLYPENWIEPELRDDKSIFFDDLEAEILQEDITDESATKVYKNYLERLDEVDYLEVAGMYHEKDDDEGVNIVHVFARTKSKPHDYYYRKWVDDTYWTGWEKIEVDVEGEHFVPVIYQKRLMIFWLQIMEKTVEPSASALSASGSSVSAQKARKYLEFRIFWSERKHGGKWTKKKISNDFVTTPDDNHSPLELPQFYVRADATSAGELFVYPVGHLRHVGDPTNYRWYHPRGSLKFGGCSDEPRADSTLYSHKRPSYIEADHRYMKFQRDEPKLFTYVNGGKCTVLQKKVGKTFLLTFPHNTSSFKKFEPFFYEDKLRSFFVVPREIEFPIYAMVYMSMYSYVGESVPGSGAAYESPSDVMLGGRLGDYFGGTADGIDNSGTGDSADTGSWGTGAGSGWVSVQTGTVKRMMYEFSLFHHPYICLFIRQINKHGVDGLLNPDPNRSADDIDLVAQGVEEIYFDASYDPVISKVLTPYPEKEIDFKLSGGYSLYNWELFFHAPLMIADRLSQNQKFAEAQKWFHYIFDPTETEGNTPERYWRTKPFHWFNGTTSIQQLLYLLNQGNQEAERQVAVWRKNPFNPHLIARMRLIAYMKTVVMKYLDNLIAWGDYLFSQDSIESINEATQLYILAAQILGRRPQEVQRDDVAPKTYNQLEPLLDAFSNALVQLENSGISGGGSGSGGSSGSTVLANVLYFCIPPNDKLMGYWDLVADRLFKIRHCMNIEGLVRQLPLFQPPIDPAMLVKAAAAGVDLGSALNDLNAALPHYRFRYMIQKAKEFNGDVQSLSNALLSALEKKDAEALALLRARHEPDLHASIKNMKALAIEDADATILALEHSKEGIEARRQYYAGRPYMISNETLQLKKMERAVIFQAIGQGINILGSALSLLPNFNVGVSGFGGTPTVTASFGGQQLGTALSMAGGVMSLLAAIQTHGATRAGIKGGYDRRKHEWDFQAAQATKEKEQVDKQLVGARIRKAMAEKDLETIELQIEQASEVVTFMEDKYTNTDLYGWMVSEISSLYFQSYQLAYDLAKRAEKAYQHELAIPNTDFIQFGYWDSLKKGLLAGDRLNKDLRRMESSYIDKNKREFEITKHVSLAMLDPQALVNLRENGVCIFEIPEIMYDLDFPGHYLRRIKSVSLTIPCVTGPYTSVSAKLSLTHNRVRKDALAGGGYAYSGLNDPRFDHDIVGTQSIATSSGNSDDGLFELRFEDDRYLPFEGGGAISSWRVELPDQFRQFDYDTISDLILHINYTARDGGDTLKTAAVNYMQTGINNLLDELAQTGDGLLRLVSMRHEFPTEFHQFLHPGAQDNQQTTLAISQRHFPHLVKEKTLSAINPVVILKLKDGYTGAIPATDLFHLQKGTGTEVQQSNFAANPAYGNLPTGTVTLTADPVGDWTLIAKKVDIQALPAALRTTEVIDTITYHRIVADEIQDIMIMFEYTAS